jgi:GMP synthase (glutamine-hydrolysing)
LGVRILGDVTAGDALEVLRQVDEVFINSIREWGLYDKIWQAFAVFLPVRYAVMASEMPRGSHSQI